MVVRLLVICIFILAVSNPTSVNAKYSVRTAAERWVSVPLILNANGVEDMDLFKHPNLNHAPELLNQPVILNGTSWIGPIGLGVLVSDLLQTTASDADQDSLGMAVTAASLDVGHWQYLLPSALFVSPASASQWTTLRNVNETSAALLTSDSRLRFVPNDGVSGTAVLSFRAWDGTDHLDPVTDRANTLLNGYANPYSETKSVLMGRNYPTSVSIFNFETQAVEEGIALTWQTATEINSLGFYISRQSSLDSEMVRITTDMIEAQSPGSLIGEVYEWLDRSADPNLVNVYGLEVVQLDGSILIMNANYVPVAPAPWRIHLPMIIR